MKKNYFHGIVDDREESKVSKVSFWNGVVRYYVTKQYGTYRSLGDGRKDKENDFYTKLHI